MRKTYLAALMLAIFAMAAPAQQEYPALTFAADGEVIEGYFVRHNGSTVSLRINGTVTNFNASDLGVVIFDNGYTNFYRDKDNMHLAAPHLVILKNGAVIPGNVYSMVPNGRITIATNRGATVTYNSVEVARIYFNPGPLFDSVEITGQNSLAMLDDGEDEPEAGNPDERDRKKDRKKNKRKDKNDENVVKLGGGEVFISFRDGGVTRGIVKDLSGNPLQVSLQDGRTFPLTSLRMINYVETRTNYPADQNKINPGFATLILRNGAVVSGTIIDYRGAGEWELHTGQRIPWSQIARIYF
jgi:hypothetical protein